MFMKNGTFCSWANSFRAIWHIYLFFEGLKLWNNVSSTYLKLKPSPLSKFCQKKICWTRPSVTHLQIHKKAQLKAGGQPSTRWPPGRLAELPKLWKKINEHFFICKKIQFFCKIAIFWKNEKMIKFQFETSFLQDFPQRTHILRFLDTKNIFRKKKIMKNCFFFFFFLFFYFNFAYLHFFLSP